jgi:hypothetical protein
MPGGVDSEDADESLPVAVSAARQAGARFVIAVDVSARGIGAPSLVERDLTGATQFTSPFGVTRFTQDG